MGLSGLCICFEEKSYNQTDTAQMAMIYAVRAVNFYFYFNRKKFCDEHQKNLFSERLIHIYNVSDNYIYTYNLIYNIIYTYTYKYTYNFNL